MAICIKHNQTYDEKQGGFCYQCAIENNNDKNRCLCWECNIVCCPNNKKQMIKDLKNSNILNG
jgi:hypothetical protein